LIDVMALWLSIAAVIAMFAPTSPVAALLLAPYLTWVTIAGFLNLRMIQLNPATEKAEA
jgi:tryptophan-rich sensory protein